MKVVCPKCKAKLKLDTDKIRSGTEKFKCPGCASILRPRKRGRPNGVLSSPVTRPPLPVTGGIQDGKNAETLALARRLDMEMGFAADDKPEEVQEVVPEAGPGLPAETAEKLSAEAPLPAAQKDGPFIPGENPGESVFPGETLLEEFTPAQLGEFDEGEPEAGDIEWTRFADNKKPQLPASKIDMNELPPSFTFLKETLVKLRQAEKLNLEGETRISKHLFTQAIKDFSRALEINPDYVDALSNRGSALARLGRFNDALADFNHALKFEKNDAEIYNGRGEIYLQNKMYDQAIKDFTAALILNPMHSYAYLNRGRAYSEKGMQEEAMADFKQAIKSDFDRASSSFAGQASPGVYREEENTADSQKAAAFSEQGLADLENERYEEAVENFTRVIGLAAGDAEGYINRGQAYIKLSQPDKAIADFKKAALLAPLNPSLYYWRAQAWKAKGELANMAGDLKLSCELGFEPACLSYSKCRPLKKQPVL